MTEEFLLPQKLLENFFELPFRNDSSFDISALKKELPAVYWQLPTQFLEKSDQQVSQPTTSSHWRLVQQRLWLDDILFSQLLFFYSTHSLEIVYLQLLPSSPPSLLSPAFQQLFLQKYIICLRKTIKNINEFCTFTEIPESRVTLFNGDLAKIFKQQGYVAIEAQKNNATTLPMKKTRLIYKPKPAGRKQPNNENIWPKKSETI